MASPNLVPQKVVFCHGLLAQYVADAAEGATYASYYFVPDKTKKDREGEPFACFVQPPNGNRKYCHSSEEFDVLVKPFMER